MIYRVDVDITKSTYTWIQAPDRATAQAEAEEMVFNDRDWAFEVDETINVYEVSGSVIRPPDPREEVWTGGPDGAWVEARSLEAR